MKCCKKALSVVLALMMVISVIPLTGITAFAATSGDFEYSVLSETDKTCEITKYNGSASELDIPSQLDGYTVTSISYHAFVECTSLSSVTIPNSVTIIGDGAFRYCTSLASITIHDSVTSIGDNAFQNCTSLISVTIPDSVTRITGNVFNGCTSMQNIYVSQGNENYSDIDGVLFSEQERWLIAYPAGKEGDYTIPESVTSISNHAFAHCESLTSVTIPNNVHEIC